MRSGSRTIRHSGRTFARPPPLPRRRHGTNDKKVVRGGSRSDIHGNSEKVKAPPICGLADPRHSSGRAKLVGSSWHTPGETLANNTACQINLLGTSEEYGLVYADELPIKETNPLRPLSPYAVSKVAQDLMGFQYFHSYGLPIMRTRAFNHEGPRRGEVFVTSNFARQIAEIEAGLRKPVILVGDLKPRRDYYWMLLVRDEPGEVYKPLLGAVVGDSAGARLLRGAVAHEGYRRRDRPSAIAPLRRDGAGRGLVQDPKLPGLGSGDSVRAYAEGSARVLASACRVVTALSPGGPEKQLRAPRAAPLRNCPAGLFLPPSFPEKCAGALAAVRALLALCLSPTCAVSFVLTSPHWTLAGASGPPPGFNPGQVPNPRTQRYTDPKALHHRQRSEPDWGMLSGLVLARPMEAAGNDAFPAGRATEEALVSLHSGEAYAHRRDGPRPTTGGWCAISPGAAAYRGAPTLAGDSGTLRDRRVISRGRAVGCCTGPRSPRSRPDRPSFYQRLRTNDYPAKVAITAAMGKLTNAILRDRRPSARSL